VLADQTNTSPLLQQEKFFTVSHSKETEEELADQTSTSPCATMQTVSQIFNSSLQHCC
jgi:hypothetical protein